MDLFLSLNLNIDKNHIARMKVKLKHMSKKSVPLLIPRWLAWPRRLIGIKNLTLPGVVHFVKIFSQKKVILRVLA